MSIFDKFRNAMAAAQREGLVFEHYPDSYPHDVVTCVEAAGARCVALHQELKHLLLETSEGLALAHVPGDARVSLRKVKRVLNVDQAHLADLSVELGGGVSCGTVCAFAEPFWSLLHLIDTSVFSAGLMTTNDTTLRGYVKFDPRVLLLTGTAVVGDIIETTSGNGFGIVGGK